ncbi:MAG: sensor domain CHASE-containing protein [Maribacter sp.]|jgi:sensor domain CHASE-containing protein
MLTENKFSKYLLYAVGEILLVVIGILIALQIDTWNEEKKNQVIVTANFNQLGQDLNNNRTSIQKLSDQLDSNRAKYQNYLGIIDQPEFPIDSSGDIKLIPA